MHVAIDERLGGAAEAGRADIAIDPRFRGPDRQALHRAAHGEHRSMEDVQPVDLLDRGKRHRPGERALLEPRGEHLAALGRKQLGIREAVDAARRIEDHGGGIHRAGEWATPRLVDAANQRVI